MLISFVFSFRNEESNLVELVRRVSDATKKIVDIDYEMIFVNDASTDSSLSLLLEMQKTFPITIINMSRRFGVTPCVLAGFEYAKGDAVIYMDSDLQDPPELIGELIEKFRQGAHVVHTTRTEREGEGFVKLLITKFAYRIINRFSEIRLPENTGDFKLLSAQVVQRILNLKEYDPYMRGLSVWVGFKQVYVNYKREPRWSGQTKFPLFSKGPVSEFLRGITAYSAAPLYAALLIGVISLIIAIVLFIYALITKLFQLSTPGASGILIAVAFFSGIILITNGVIGIYIARIYYEVKGRPKYIIEDIIRK